MVPRPVLIPRLREDIALLANPRPTYPVPSCHHQTILSKCLYEHFVDYAQVASVALASKSIQNSSLSPNFASNIVIDEKSAILFATAFHPSTSLPIQFVPALHIDFGVTTSQIKLIDSFTTAIKKTKYFHKSLRFLTIERGSLIQFLGEGHHQLALARHKLDLKKEEVSTNNNNDGAEFFEQFPNLQSVKLISIPQFLTQEDISIINSTLPSLRTLGAELFSSPAMGDDDLKKLVTIEKLCALSLRGFSTGQHDILNHLIKATNLTSLELLDASGISDEVITKFTDAFQELKILKLTRCSPELTDAGIQYLTLGHQMEQLQLRRCYINDEKLRIISLHCPELTKLDLAGNPGITDEGVDYVVSSFSRLTYLCLARCSISSASLVKISLLRHLDELNLIGCRGLTFDTKSLHLLPVFTGVKTLRLSECVECVTDENLPQIIASFPNARCLMIGGCTGITDAGLSNLHSLEFLEVLEVKMLDKITDAGLISLVNHANSRLLALDVSQCPTVTDEFLFQTVARLKSFSLVDLQFCPQITAYTLWSKIYRVCPRLTMYPDFGDPTYRKSLMVRFCKFYLAAMLVLSVLLAFYIYAIVTNGELADYYFGGVTDYYESLMNLSIVEQSAMEMIAA